MESILAKLAVYNSAEFFGQIKQTVLTLISSVSVGIFLFVMSAVCIAAGTLYLKSYSRKPIASDFAKISRSKTFSEVTSVGTYIDGWLLSFASSSSELASLWIQALNKELAPFHDELHLYLHSIDFSRKINFKITHTDSIQSSDFDESFLKIDLFLPLATVKCRLSGGNGDASKSVSLQIADFYSKLKALVVHNANELLSVNMQLYSNSEFTVLADDRTVDIFQIKTILMKTLPLVKVLWRPNKTEEVCSGGVSISRPIPGAPAYISKHSSKNTNEVSTQATQVDVSRPQTSQVFEPWNAPNFPLRNAISVESAQSSHKNANFPCEERVESGMDFRGVRKLLNIHDNPVDISCNAPDETFGISTSTNSSSSEGYRTDTPVVLAHNATVRQSIVASQLPRKSGPRLVRSASYYGENSSFTLHSTDECNNSNTFVDSFIVDLVTPVPTSASTEVRLSELCSPTQTDKLIPGHSAEFEEQKTPQPELNEGYQRDKPLPSDATFLQEGEIVGEDIACKKLLIKVVKAEGLLLKGTSNAYCVVELDEPYQRHTTHCSSAGQLFWDQHLLFDLNTNSKRIALEVFELFKRKKSVSKGRSELLLQSLFAPSIPDLDTDTESITTGVWDASQFRRCLPLINRADPVLSPGVSISGSSSPGVMTTPGAGTAAFSFAPGGIYQSPTITAEFHFMEKANEEVLAARLRASGHGLHHPSTMHRTCSARVSGPQSVSAQDSPILGCSSAAVTSTTNFTSLSHSTSLEFGVSSKFVPSLKPTPTTVIAETEAIVEVTDLVDLPVPQVATLTRKSNIAKCSPLVDAKPSHNTLTSGGSLVSSSLKTAELFSPVPLRRAQLDQINQSDKLVSPSSPSSSLKRQKIGGKVTDDVFIEPPRISRHLDSARGSISERSASPSGIALSKGISWSDKPSSDVIDTGAGEHLQRTDSLLKRSNILGADESNSPSQRILLPFPDSDFECTKDDSHLVVNPNTPSRSQSLASRLKSSRLSGALLRPGKRSNEESFGSSTSSLALLGPSRQLAGVVAGLSSLSGDSGSSPISAAAFASAMAVAGATGSWQPDGSQLDVGTDAPSSSSARQSKSTESENRSDGKAGVTSGSHDPPLRYAPPAACVAAESPGTFTPLSQPRRSDASNLGLFRLFRHKKKRFRSVGAEKLLFLDSTDLEDLDALSTEGYYRIVQDTDPNLQPSYQHKQ